MSSEPTPSDYEPKRHSSELMGKEGQRSIFQPVGLFEYVGRAPLVFLGLGFTVGSLFYGFWSLFKGDMVGQARGMSGRVGFQVITIGLLVGALSYRQNQKDQEKVERDARRALRKAQAEETKATRERLAHRRT